MNGDNHQMIDCFAPNDIVYGSTYGEWTIKWWEWVLSIAESNNPVLDNSGENAHLNQNHKVWFLAGTIGDDNVIAHRTCIVPKGKHIMFPIINYIYTEDRPFNEMEVINHVKNDIDDIVVKEASIDGYRVPIYRVKSDPFLFNLKVTEENKFGIRVGEIDACADGYWVFIKSLSEGAHEIKFHGACSGGIRNAAANYSIRIK